MQIRFADSRPDGDYALVVAVAGKNRSALDQIGGERPAIDAILSRQRFEGDSGSAAELFLPAEKGVRRVLVVGVGDGSSPADSAEKLGGTAIARLLTSGETHVVIDLSGADYDADAAARVALAASLRGWRYDVYRTRMKDKQKPTVKDVTIVGANGDAAGRWEQRWKPVYEGAIVTRELVTEPAGITAVPTFTTGKNGAGTVTYVGTGKANLWLNN